MNTAYQESTYFKLVACWSKAGIGTSIVVESSLGTRIALDIGATQIFHEAAPAKIVLVTHGHLDHIGGIFSHARAHYSSSSPPAYYVPSALAGKLEAARQAMSDLDSANDGSGCRTESLIAMNIIGVSPGDEIQVGKTNGDER